jgi:lipid II:glycine glycyltransferase (peptidoglycan interpeptide bridge formation enzyme)
MIEISFISIDSAKKIINGLDLLPFQEYFWWNIVEKGFGKECKLLLLSDNGNNKLLMPLFFHKLGPFLRVGSPLRGTHTPHIDPIVLSEDVDTNFQQIYIKKVLLFLLKNGADWIEFTYANHQIFNGLNAADFLVETPSTSILKTNLSEDVLWNGMQGRARNLVRKAEKFDLVANFLDSKKHNVDLFYSMLEETFKKSGNKPPHSKEFYTFLVDSLIASNNLLFLSIEKESKVVAMGIFMFNNNEINFISGTSTQIGNKYGANNLMHWEVIKFASTNNIKQYNFGGLGISSIDKFKRSFGGNDVEYKRYILMKPFVQFLFNTAMKIKNILSFIRQEFKRFKR